jgi:hypothetical protein
MKINLMKPTILVLGFLCFLCTTSAFGQTAPVLSNQAQPVQMSDHPLHASEHSMATESSLLSTSTYSYAKGEIPISEFAGTLKPETPLGDIARSFRNERAATAKAVLVLEK